MTEGEPSGQPLTILHEDDDLVAIDKPAGAVVHRTRGAAGAPVLVDLLGWQRGHRIFPLHRLDRQTSGVVLFAKSSEVAARLSRDIRDQLWRKQYVGLCRGLIESSVIVDRAVPEGDKRRSAQSEIEPLEQLCGRFSLVRARPRTGRRHQLRYHFKHLRHPLVGDVNYGQGAINRFFRGEFGLHRLFLHAERLELPLERSWLSLSAPLASELREVLAALRCYEGPVP